MFDAITSGHTLFLTDLRWFGLILDTRFCSRAVVLGGADSVSRLPSTTARFTLGSAVFGRRASTLERKSCVQAAETLVIDDRYGDLDLRIASL